MRIPTHRLFVLCPIALLLTGVHPLRAQQTPPSTPPPASDAPASKPISPSTPPPPPPGARPETRSDTRDQAHPDASSGESKNAAQNKSDGQPADTPIDPSTPPPPPPADAPSAPSAESAEPSFDPYHAQKSLDVGTFYLKKGNYDAAIDRFQEAARYQPSLAMPWRLLGETYEKQHAYAPAIESYKKYLEVFPRAADAARITRQIALLEEKVGKEPAKDAPH